MCHVDNIAKLPLLYEMYAFHTKNHSTHLETVWELIWFSANLFNVKSHWKDNCSQAEQHHCTEE